MARSASSSNHISAGPQPAARWCAHGCDRAQRHSAPHVRPDDSSALAGPGELARFGVLALAGMISERPDQGGRLRNVRAGVGRRYQDQFALDCHKLICNPVNTAALPRPRLVGARQIPFQPRVPFGNKFEIHRGTPELRANLLAWQPTGGPTQRKKKYRITRTMAGTPSTHPIRYLPMTRSSC